MCNVCNWLTSSLSDWDCMARIGVDPTSKSFSAQFRPLRAHCLLRAYRFLPFFFLILPNRLIIAPIFCTSILGTSAHNRILEGKMKIEMQGRNKLER